MTTSASSSARSAGSSGASWELTFRYRIETVGSPMQTELNHGLPVQTAQAVDYPQSLGVPTVGWLGNLAGVDALVHLGQRHPRDRRIPVPAGTPQQCARCREPAQRDRRLADDRS